MLVFIDWEKVFIFFPKYSEFIQEKVSQTEAESELDLQGEAGDLQAKAS
mgnify:CR=1 FL=1